MSDSFITAASKIQRLASGHQDIRRKAIEEINKLIAQAPALPILIPWALFTEIDVVRSELLRKLREEAGWHVDAVPSATHVILKARPT